MLNSLPSQDPSQLPHIPQTPATSAAYTTHDPNVQHSAHTQLPPSAYTQHIPTNQQQYFLQQQQLLQYPGLLFPYLYATDPFMHIRMQHLFQMCKTMEQVQMQQTGQIPMMPNLFPPMYSFLQTNIASMPTSDMSAGVSQPSPPQSPSQSQPENDASIHQHGHVSHLSEQESHEIEMKTPTDLANLEQALIEKLHIHKKDPSLLGSYQATSSTSSMTTGTGGSEYDYQQSLTIESRDELADHVPVNEVGFHEEPLSGHDHQQLAPADSTVQLSASGTNLLADASNTEGQSIHNKKSRFVVSTVREDPITPNPSEESSPALVESPQALLEDNMHSSGQRFHTTKKGRFHVTSMQDSPPTAASSFTNTAPPPPQMPPDVNGLRVCTSTAQMAEVNGSLASIFDSVPNKNLLSPRSGDGANPDKFPSSPHYLLPPVLTLPEDELLNVDNPDSHHPFKSPINSLTISTDSDTLYSHNLSLPLNLLDSRLSVPIECATQTSPEIPLYRRYSKVIWDDASTKEVFILVQCFLFYLHLASLN